MKEFIYIRHGERPSTQDSIKIINNWRLTKRYKENPADEPLTVKGILESYKTGANLGKYVNITKYKYIYSSPLTRCLDTSVQIIKAIKKKYNHDIKIRVEYSLAETIKTYLILYPIIKNNKVKTFNIFDQESNENGIYPVIDKQLYYGNIVKNYKQYIDLDYTPMYNHTFINKVAPFKLVQAIIDTIDNIVKTNDYSIVVGHATNAYIWASMYLLQLKNINFHDYNMLNDGMENVNFVAIYSKKNSVWEKTMGPERII